MALFPGLVQLSVTTPSPAAAVKPVGLAGGGLATGVAVAASEARPARPPAQARIRKPYCVPLFRPVAVKVVRFPPPPMLRQPPQAPGVPRQLSHCQRLMALFPGSSQFSVTWPLPGPGSAVRPVGAGGPLTAPLRAKRRDKVSEAIQLLLPSPNRLLLAMLQPVRPV